MNAGPSTRDARNLFRNAAGNVIHHADCRYVTRGRHLGTVYPWHWADGMSWPAIARAIRRYGYHTCSRCQPIPTNPDAPEQVHRKCPRCGRLLAPQNGGKMPHHRRPPPRGYDAGSVPLTGRDAPWCT